MTDTVESRPFEEQLAVVEGWIGRLTSEGVVGQIDPLLIRDVLGEFGANFEISEEAKESLSKFSNANRRVGMDAVWGNEKVKEYRIWLRHYLEDYEALAGRALPVLEGTDTKTSGGLKFFTDLTVFAAGLMAFEEYKRITERRAEKGRIWQARKEDEPYIPTKYSSFPPELPQAAWQKIKSWGND